jgi:hypothetical protein
MSSDLIFLYDQVIESLARLHGFSSMRAGDLGRSNDIEDDVDHVSELMAKRDLLTFSASTRNFAEASKAVGDMRSVAVPTCKLLPLPLAAPFFMEGSETITLYQALSRILHSSSIDILRSAEDYEYQLAHSHHAFFQMVADRAGQTITRTEPLILVVSENDTPTLLRVRSIVLRSCAFLNTVSNRLSHEDRIFLQRDYRDL